MTNADLQKWFREENQRLVKRIQNVYGGARNTHTHTQSCGPA